MKGYEAVNVMLLKMLFGKLPVAYKLFHDGGPYHIETSPLICSANQWAGFYMLETSVMKELRVMSYNITWYKISLKLL